MWLTKRTVILAQNKATYSAYPTVKKKIQGNVEKTSISTQEKNLRLVRINLQNSSTS